MKRKTTTRQIEYVEFDEAGNIVEMVSEQPAIDVSLSMLAFINHGAFNFSGKIETSWSKGGMREPQTPGYSNEARRKIIAHPMKELLPMGYSGIAIWNLNSGELSGRPKLIPFS